MSLFRSRAKILSQLSQNGIIPQTSSSQLQKTATNLKCHVSEIPCIQNAGLSQDVEVDKVQNTLSESLLSLIRKKPPDIKEHEISSGTQQKKNESWFIKLFVKPSNSMTPRDRCIIETKEIQKQEVECVKLQHQEQKSENDITTNDYIQRSKIDINSDPSESLAPLPLPTVKAQCTVLQAKPNITPLDLGSTIQGKLNIENVGPEKRALRSVSAKEHTQIELKEPKFPQQSIKTPEIALSNIEVNTALIQPGRKNMKYFTHRNYVDLKRKNTGNSLEQQVKNRKDALTQFQSKVVANILPVKNNARITEENINKILPSKMFKSPFESVTEKSPSHTPKIQKVSKTKSLITSTNKQSKTENDFKKSWKSYKRELTGTSSSARHQKALEQNSLRNVKITGSIKNLDVLNKERNMNNHKNIKTAFANDSPNILKAHRGSISTRPNKVPEIIKTSKSIKDIKKSEETHGSPNSMNSKEKSMYVPKLGLKNWLERIKEREKILARGTTLEKSKSDNLKTNNEKIKYPPIKVATKDWSTEITNKKINKQQKENQTAFLQSQTLNNIDSFAKINALHLTSNLRIAQSSPILNVVRYSPRQRIYPDKTFSTSKSSQDETSNKTHNTKEPVWKNVISYTEAKGKNERKITNYKEYNLLHIKPTKTKSSHEINNTLEHLQAKPPEIHDNLFSQDKSNIKNKIYPNNMMKNNMFPSEQKMYNKNFVPIKLKNITAEEGKSSMVESENKISERVSSVLQGDKNKYKTQVNDTKFTENTNLTSLNESSPAEKKFQQLGSNIENVRLPKSGFLGNTSDEIKENVSEICNNCQANHSENIQAEQQQIKLNNDIPDKATFEALKETSLSLSPSKETSLSKLSDFSKTFEADNIFSECPCQKGQEEYKTCAPTDEYIKTSDIFSDLKNPTLEKKLLENQRKDDENTTEKTKFANTSKSIDDENRGAQVNKFYDIPFPSILNYPQPQLLTKNNFQNCMSQEQNTNPIINKFMPLKVENSLVPVETNNSILNINLPFSNFTAYFYGAEFPKHDMLNFHMQKLEEKNSKEQCPMLLENKLTKICKMEMKEIQSDETCVENYGNSEELFIKSKAKKINDEMIIIEELTKPPNECNKITPEINCSSKYPEDKKILSSSNSPCLTIHGHPPTRNYSSWKSEEPFNMNIGSYECKTKPKGTGGKKGKSKKEKSKDKCKKEKSKNKCKSTDKHKKGGGMGNQAVLICDDKKYAHHGKCKKIKMPGCRLPVDKACEDDKIESLPCIKKEAPVPSFSECARYPLVEPKLTECDCLTRKKMKCKSTFNHPVTYDACRKKKKIHVKKKKKKEEELVDDDEGHFPPCEK